MAVLSWGRCQVAWGVSDKGTTASFGNVLPIPKQDTTKLNTSSGSATEALEEGGEVVDVRYSKSTYELEFELFVKKGESIPTVGTEKDGLIIGDYGFKVTPEDPECYGIQIDRAHVNKEITFASADGIIVKFVAKALKPASGEAVKLIPGTKES